MGGAGAAVGATTGAPVGLDTMGAAVGSRVGWPVGSVGAHVVGCVGFIVGLCVGMAEGGVPTCTLTCTPSEHCVPPLQHAWLEPKYRKRLPNAAVLNEYEPAPVLAASCVPEVVSHADQRL